MTTIEDRLRDAFTALDAQVVVPPMAEPTSRRLPVAWLATAAAAVLAVLVGVTVWTNDESGDDVMADRSPEAFDESASTICATFMAAAAESSPRFATTDAYVVVADARGRAIATMIASLEGLPDDPDDPFVRERAIEQLEAAAGGVAAVGRRAAAGDLDGAVEIWRSAEARQLTATDMLGSHGADGCRR